MKNKRVVFYLFLATSLILFSTFVSSAPINNSLHLNLQTTFPNGSIQASEVTPFVFAFNLTDNSDASCIGNVVYNHSVSQTTDSRGIVSIYLPPTGSGGGSLDTIDFDRQYY